jgi:two-component system sensor histidine kinase RegB
MDRIGEPYVSSRRSNPAEATEKPAGLGLGLFIAKTLLERSGATLTFENRARPERGAVVRLRWSRSDFERPLTFVAA